MPFVEPVTERNTDAGQGFQGDFLTLSFLKLKLSDTSFLPFSGPVSPPAGKAQLGACVWHSHNPCGQPLIIIAATY